MQQSNIKIKELQFTNADFLPEVVKLVDEGHTCTIQLRGFSMRPFLEDNRDKALLAKPKALKRLLAGLENRILTERETEP